MFLLLLLVKIRTFVAHQTYKVMEALKQLKKDMRIGKLSDAEYFDGIIELQGVEEARKELAQMKRNGLISHENARAIQKKIDSITPKI